MIIKYAMRTEKDNIGELILADDPVYGLQTYRALQNFPQSGEKVNIELINAFLLVKKAAAITNAKLGKLPKEKAEFILQAIEELISESPVEIFEKIVVDPYQGGAGTSLNMNINEVIANIALLLSGRNYGDYEFIHPLDDVNMNQSTNDTYPTAFKVAAIRYLRELQEVFSELQKVLQEKEKEFSGIIKLGRTQLQDAVPITLGQEFSAYSQAISRNRWRFYNGEERLRSVNFGGTAVGNSVAGDVKFSLEAVNELRKLCGLPIAKAEDLMDATQNLDSVVEVHGIIKSAAVSLIKICNDLRIMSSGPGGGIGEIRLPAVQSGSTIMPGKVNPVILEHTIQVCEIVKGNDVVISNLISAGNLELHQFMPVIAHLFLKTQTMLISGVKNLTKNCIAGIKANEIRCRENLLNSTAIAASLIPRFGYDKVAAAVKKAGGSGKNLIPSLCAELGTTKEEIYIIIKNELGLDIGDNA